MSSVIYNPLEEYEKTLKDFHIKKANEFFDDIVRRSNVNIEENRKTVEQYNTYKEQGESLGVIEPMNQYRQAILEKLLSDQKIDEKLATDEDLRNKIETIKKKISPSQFDFYVYNLWLPMQKLCG